MKICIAGKNEIAVYGLEFALKRFRREDVCVCPNRDDDGISRWQPSLIRFAKEWGIRICNINELYEIDGLVFLSLEFDQIVRPDRFKSNRLYNLHFSLLPAYKGMYTSVWPILNGDKCTGITLHKIDKGIDTGDIITQCEIKIEPLNTARDLYFAYMQAGSELINQWFDVVINDDYAAVPQSAVGSSYYSKTSIDYSNLKMDLNNTAESVVRQSKAFHFREFQIPEINGIKIANGEICSSRSHGKPGLVSLHGSDVLVCTIDYDVMFKHDRSWDIFQMLEKNDLSGIEKLTGKKEILDIINVNGWTPLIVAIYHGNIKMVRALIQAGADIRKTNKNGTTPLMYAKSIGQQTGNFSISQLLLDAGAEIDACDRFGKTLLDYIELDNETNAIKFFKGLC